MLLFPSLHLRTGRRLFHLRGKGSPRSVGLSGRLYLTWGVLLLLAALAIPASAQTPAGVSCPVSLVPPAEQPLPTAPPPPPPPPSCPPPPPPPPPPPRLLPLLPLRRQPHCPQSGRGARTKTACARFRGRRSCATGPTVSTCRRR